MQARDRRFDNRGQRITSFESVYDGRRRRQQADDAGERDERGVGMRAGVAHLACWLAFAPVVHRTDLSGEQTRAALFVVVGGGDAPAAERERRGDDAGDLTREPERHDPRKAAANSRHGSQ